MRVAPGGMLKVSPCQWNTSKRGGRPASHFSVSADSTVAAGNQPNSFARFRRTRPPSALLSSWPQILVVIDDYDRFSDRENEARRTLAELLASGGNLGVGFILAGNISELPRDYDDPFIQAVRKQGNGVLLCGTEGIEQFNNARRPQGQPGAGLPPGRGFLIRRGQVRLLQTAVKVLVVIGVAVIAFLFEELLHIRPALIALAAAATGLILVQPDIKTTLNRIEWDVLLFFGALFIMVGGMEHAGVMRGLSSLITEGGSLPPMVLGLVLLWVVAISSAFIDNIPITIALIPVVLDLAAAGINPNPLWWALAFGAGFGGNGTIIGSTANVVIVSLSERTRHPITASTWNKRGLPVMLATCATASVLYILFFPWLSR